MPAEVGEQPTDMVEFTVKIDFTFDENEIINPFFRYKFIDNKEITTKNPFSEIEWVKTVSPQERNEGEGAPQQTSTPENGDGGENSTDNATSTQRRPLYTYCRTFTPMKRSEDFALQLNRSPIVAFFLADESVTKCTRVYAQNSELPEERNGRNYVGIFEVDISALLDDTTCVVTQEWSTKIDSLALESEGVQRIRISISVDQPLLSAEMCRKLNPLRISIDKIRNLPGIIVESKQLLDYTQPSPFTQLERFCRPIYVSFKFYGSELGMERVIRTPKIPQGPKAKWNFETVVLCGALDYSILTEKIGSEALKIEVHDRDLLNPKQITANIQEWEALITGGQPIPKREAENFKTDIKEKNSEEGGKDTAKDEESVEYTKPMKIYQVDAHVIERLNDLYNTSGDHNAHGIASFRMYELLDTAKQISAAFKRRVSNSALSSSEQDQSISLKLTSEVTPQKKRILPKGGLDEEVDLSMGERLVRKPGQYLDTFCTLCISLKLKHPLVCPPRVGGDESTSCVEKTENEAEEEANESEQAEVEPIMQVNSDSSLIAEVKEEKVAFQRMVFVFRYGDVFLLRRILNAIDSVNQAALPSVNLRTYQLTKLEKQRSMSGELDILTGCMIIDFDYRMIIVEGVAGKAMKVLSEQVPREEPNNKETKILANNSLQFANRLYTQFEVDLKKIKLRDSLPVLMKMPEIYMRSKVSANCFAALSRLADIREANRLHELKTMDLFPLPVMLLDVESKYGESISMEDINGTKERENSKRSKKRDNASESLGSSFLSPDTSAVSEINEMDSLSSMVKQRSSQVQCRKAPTDSKNDAFDEAKRSWKPRDYLNEARILRETIKDEYERRKALVPESNEEIEVFMYSGQSRKNNITNALEEEMLKQSKQNLLQENENNLITRRRPFVYPAPRPVEEYYHHPRAPSLARSEELRQPWVENEYHPKPVSREDNLAEEKDPFNSLPSKDMVFGGTNADGSVNKDYFKSVHLGGDGMEAELREACEREQQEWQSKLVVEKDNLRFIAHGNVAGQTCDKTAQVDRVKDILDGKPKSKPIRRVRNARLPSGRSAAIRQVPISILSKEQFVDSNDFLKNMRRSQPENFVGKNFDGNPIDFRLRIHREVMLPKSQKILSRVPISPLKGTEYKDDRFNPTNYPPREKKMSRREE